MGAEDVASTAQRAEATASLQKKKASINKGKTILKAKLAKKDVEKELVAKFPAYAENKSMKQELASMGAEDVNRADVAPTRPRGRPKKYATAEEAKLAKATKTVEAKKKRQALKKEVKAQKKAKPTENIQMVLEETPSRPIVPVVSVQPPPKKKRGGRSPCVNGKYLKGSKCVPIPKTGGMFGWVQSVIGRHPTLTRRQIEEAERYADSLMADTNDIDMEGTSILPKNVRKELAEEYYNRNLMGREDVDATGDASDVFADEIRKQQEQEGKGFGGSNSTYTYPPNATPPRLNDGRTEAIQVFFGMGGGVAILYLINKYGIPAVRNLITNTAHALGFRGNRVGIEDAVLAQVEDETGAELGSIESGSDTTGVESGSDTTGGAISNPEINHDWFHN
jgi:hypothetical protein